MDPSKFDIQAPESNKKDSEKPRSISFFKLLTFASKSDWLLMTVGSLAAVANGAALPFFALVFGDMTDALAPGSSPDIMVDLAYETMFKFFWIGIGAALCSWISMSCWMISGERQAINFRRQYFRALLRQEIGWFDMLNPAELSSKIASECFAIQQGVGEKISTVLYASSTLIAGFVVGFLSGWQLTLVLCATLPILVIGGSLFIYALQKQAIQQSKAYSIAGALAEQALTAIRTVVGLTGEPKELNAYKSALISVKKTVLKFGVFSAFAFGISYCSFGITYCLGFWTGGAFVKSGTINPVTDEPYQVGDVLTIFFAIMIGSFTFATVGPAMKSVALAKQAGHKVLEIINRNSFISYEDACGETPANIQGKVTFQNVSFKYPANQEKFVLQDLDLVIEPNKKTALVGHSGCGKSTCMQLIERFYDPTSGVVTLDNTPFKILNIKWLRSHIGYVGQEPVLFSTTIRDNMKMAKLDASDKEIIEALKKARAWSFLSQGKQLDTYVGTGGAQLSGGQKQRIAIARAILKDPKILLLDEATSALDRTNEKEIQNTLDEISEGRTTIVIAHRLSTVRNADKIVLFEEGNVVEAGSHEELIRKQGRYYEMQKLQLNTDDGSSQKRYNKSHPLYEPPFEETDVRDSFAMERPYDRKNSRDQKLTTEGEIIAVKEVQADIRNQEGLVAQDALQNIIAVDSSHAVPTEQPLQPPLIDSNAATSSQSKYITKDIEKKSKADKKAEKLRLKAEKSAVTKKLYGYSKPDRKMFYGGLLSAILNGTVLPLYAVLLSFVLQEIGDPTAPDYSEQVRLLALMFLLLGVASLVLYTLMLSTFSIVGENLTQRLRSDLYDKMLRMHIGWHDDPNNNPATLATTLSTDTLAVNSLTSTAVGATFQMSSSFITGMVVAFIGSWQVTLVGLALSPIMIISGKMTADFNVGFSAKTDGAYKEASVFVSESLTNMRTVASLGKEDEVLRLYSDALRKPAKAATKKGFVSGLFFGLSQLGIFIVFGVIFYIGSLFMRDYDLEFRQVYQAVFGIMFASIDMGNSMQLIPDAARSMAAAKSIFSILGLQSKIDFKSPDGKSKDKIQGDIEFLNVSFKYPSRDKQVFQNLSFKAAKGSKVALVGPSGCGKSTVMQLLLRFYDVDSGEILIDGKNIKDYDIHHLRSYFGVVSQEPVIFEGTIEDNIR